MPSVERCIERVGTRQGHGFTDEGATRHMYRQFARADVNGRHLLVDPPNDAEEVADMIVAALEQDLLAYRDKSYVWVGNVMVNLSLLAGGYAQVSTFLPNVKYVEEFLEAQRDARRHERGLWDRCQEEPVIDVGGGEGGGGACDASYPDVCIPPYPPDLDCGEVAPVNFRVTGSDPHGFDGDDDGIGCET